MDIDVDDPHFWQKWAKKADLDADRLLADHDSKDKVVYNILYLFFVNVLHLFSLQRKIGFKVYDGGMYDAMDLYEL